ncbi:ferredoxin [Streptomyces sp. NPDC057582]|uniref:ferredoxin n=1 Tax=Streptomyces sp. NPDC057582 TaxID=3346174 RepID=UPI0036784C05
MRIVVDLTRCQTHAQCVFLAPEAFELPGEEALLYRPDAPDEQFDRVRQAAAAHPAPPCSAWTRRSSSTPLRSPCGAASRWPNSATPSSQHPTSTDAFNDVLATIVRAG